MRKKSELATEQSKVYGVYNNGLESGTYNMPLHNKLNRMYFINYIIYFKKTMHMKFFYSTNKDFSMRLYEIVIIGIFPVISNITVQCSKLMHSCTEHFRHIIFIT